MKRIAIFYHTMDVTSSIGRILTYLARHLSTRGYDITVFSKKIQDNENLNFSVIELPVVKKPLFALFISYHISSLLAYLWQRLVKRNKYSVKIGIESTFMLPDICYPHFCHRSYLNNEWKNIAEHIPPWLRILRFINHWLHSFLEPFVFRRARCIVVPSDGLKREIVREYPWTSDKITIIPNFIDWEYMQKPSDFDRAAFRRKIGLSDTDLVGVFVSLGAFEHKGLPLILQAVAEMNLQAKVIVVGGNLIGRWLKLVKRIGIEDKIFFVGLQKDIRPFLWVSDFFIFPSVRETFPLAVLEAAAVGMPLIVTPLYGIEEFMKDGEMGYVVSRDVSSIGKALDKLSRLSSAQRLEMSEKVREAAKRYDFQQFCKLWTNIIENY